MYSEERYYFLAHSERILRIGNEMNIHGGSIMR